MITIEHLPTNDQTALPIHVQTAWPPTLLLDDEVAVTEVAYDGVVLRHYAFAEHWFKINVTTDRQGELVEPGD